MSHAGTEVEGWRGIMNRNEKAYYRNLRESMGTLNLIAVFWLACREGGILVPELRPTGFGGIKPHPGRGRRTYVA
jgi:hypothetical protein